MSSTTLTAVPTGQAEQVAQILRSIRSAKRLQWNASQTHNAHGVFQAETILDGLYRELDAQDAAAVEAGSLIVARERVR